jgi:oligopeptide transport system substrate-binding protein
MKLLAVLFLTFCFAVSCTQEKQNDKNTVVSLLDGNIPHLDPIHSTNRYSSTINGAIFEGLYHYHYLKDPMSVEPALAESLPKITNGGRTYTIKIKKGVFFQDDPAFPDNRGRELEANDFVYSWKRLADPQNKAMGWWIFDGKIEGLNSWRNGVRKGQAQYDSPVSGLKALDSHTLQITLTQPSYQFLHLLCVPATSVVAHEVVEKYKKDIGNHPVGTGPFRLKKWVRNSEVVLEKNPKYREAFFPSDGAPANRPDLKKHAGASLPMADEVVVRIITEKQPEWLAFLKGELDHGIIPKDNNAQVIENGQLKAPMKAKGLSLHDLHKMDFTYIAFNMEDPVLGKHPKLRQAMAMALDRTLILEKFYNNRGLLAQGPIPPGIAGYNKDFQSPLVYNVKRAQELMKEAGFPNGEGLSCF